MTPDKLKSCSVALIYLERALAQAVDDEALYRDFPGHESEHLLAARIVTLIEADLAEIERVIARRADPIVRFPGSVRSRRRFGGCDGDAQHEPYDTLNQQDGAA